MASPEFETLRERLLELERGLDRLDESMVLHRAFMRQRMADIDANFARAQEILRGPGRLYVAPKDKP